jgi:hypothetical protein
MRSADRNPHALRVTLRLLWLLPIYLPGHVFAGEWDIPQDLKLPSLWVRSVDARLWSGYKDNVLLADRNLIGSPFLAGGLDMTFFRLPVNGWEYLFLTSAEYVRYLSASNVDQEVTVILQGQATKTLGQDWKLGLSGEYVYFNQVFDSSAFQDVFSSVQVQGHNFTLRPSVRKDFGQGYRLELQLPATRQEFDQFIDDYWEAGPKLIFGREYGRKSDISVAYQFGDRIHDTREARDRAGLLESGSKLQFYQHELSAVWRQHWDAERHWRTVSKLSLQRNDDNGGGYYDYWRPQFSEQIRFQAKSWEVRAEARVSYYHYDSQPIAELGSPTRAKTYLRFNLRAEKSLSKSLKAFAQFEHEEALSNLDIDRYHANTFSAGIDWEF